MIELNLVNFVAVFFAAIGFGVLAQTPIEILKAMRGR
jgi:hypothetical protein